MKFNFRKIAPVLASTILLGSTIGFAAGASDLTAYPSQFAGATVVYGADARVEDVIVGADFATDIASKYGTSTTTGGTTVSGETVKIETGSTKLHIGSALTDVKTAALTDGDMPSLLAKKTFQSKDGVSYDYEQKISLAPSLTYTMYSDLDYNSKIPTLGIVKSSNSPIVNYTLNFIKTAESDVDSNQRLEDIQDSDITMLGKTYRILNAYNTSNGIKLELMAGAVVDTLTEDANQSYVISGKTYTVSVSNVASDGAAIIVNGQTTPKLAAGSTYKLSDGTQVGIRTIWYQSNKVSKVEFSLGAEKLTIESGQKMKMNDENVNDVTCYFTSGYSSAKRTISAITLAWITNDKIFMSKDKEAVFPGLKSIKISMGDLTVPATEKINVVNSGETTINLQVPVKSGIANIPLLSLNSSRTGINHIGTDASTQYQTVTTKATELNFNRTTDQYFVATWNSSSDAESYLLKVSAVNKDSPSSGLNSTTIMDAVSLTTLCENKKIDDQCTIGNVVLNIKGINTNGDGWVNITAGSGVSFDKIFSKEGLLIYLPVNSGVTAGAGYINATTGQPTSWTLYLSEEDKSGFLGRGDTINATIGIAGTGASGKLEVSDIDSNSGNFAGSAKFDTGGTSTTSKYVAYIVSDLATKYTYDTKPDQNTLEIEYHGGEAYGNVYVASSAATVSSVSGGAKANVVNMLDTDAEIAKPATNLIVVGGPAANRVAAKILGVSYPTTFLTGDDAIADDEALIKLVASNYDSTKLALVVFGMQAKDTAAAGTFLLNNAGSSALSGKSSVKLVTASATAIIKP